MNQLSETIRPRIKAEGSLGAGDALVLFEQIGELSLMRHYVQRASIVERTGNGLGLDPFLHLPEHGE